MPRILAIEADPKRRILLAVLIREHVKAELLMADSVKSAIKIMGRKAARSDHRADAARRRRTSASCSIAHEAAAIGALRPDADRAGARHAGGPCRADAAALRLARPRLQAVFDRRRADLGPQYDRSMVGAQIADGLERARIAARRVRSRWPRTTRRWRSAACWRPRASAADAIVRNRYGERPHWPILAAGAADERRTAERKNRGDVPWLSAIKLSWGDEVGLVNISSSGVLVETGSKFIPGSTTDLHLSGPETNLIVPVRFIRSEVAHIDGRGVKYRCGRGVRERSWI